VTSKISGGAILPRFGRKTGLYFLYGRPKDNYRLYIENAHEMIEVARSNLDNDYYTLARNRAYYAIFYAASAPLYSKGSKALGFSPAPTHDLLSKSGRCRFLRSLRMTDGYLGKSKGKLYFTKPLINGALENIEYDVLIPPG
jgi:hypothetical protein